MRIVRVETLLSRGPYPKSRHWKRTRKTIHEAVSRCCWPPGSASFTIYAESGKNRGERNGVLLIKRECVEFLRDEGWAIEGKAKNALGRRVRRFDAVISGPNGPIVVEWKTGDVSSSHLSMNKMLLLLSSGLIAAGTLVVPSRELYKHLADRAGSIRELELYFPLWKSVPCENGLLEILVIEHDRTSYDVPKIPRLTSVASMTSE